MSLHSKMRLAPNSIFSNEMTIKAKEFMIKDRIRKEETAKKLRAERQELYDSSWFDRKYWIPIEKLEEFYTNPNFDVEYYSFENYRKRELRKKEIAKFGRDLYDQWVSNFIHNNNMLYYKQVVYLDNYTNRQIIRDVLDNMKNKFGSESFDPFTSQDYENGVNDYTLYNNDIVDEYNSDFEDDYDEYDSES